MVDFLDGATPLQSNVPLSGGFATFQTSSLSVSSHSITAVYHGDASFNGSSNNGSIYTQTVNRDSTTTLLTSLSPSTGVAGGSTTCNVTVTANAPGAGTPSGFVDILVNGATLATAPLDPFGKSTVPITIPQYGVYTITAQYSGDSNFFGSTSSNRNYFVEEPTTTAVSTNINPSVFGQAVTFTATVTDALNPGQNADGTVLFSVNGVVQSVQTLANGSATYVTSALAVSSQISVAYVGNATFLGSEASISQTVNQAASMTVLSSSMSPSVAGQSVTFNAMVTATAPGAGTPSGSITFKDSGAPIGAGTLSGGVATFTTATLSVGTHDITAVYNGVANFSGSTSADLSQLVNTDSTTTTLASSPNVSVFGQSVTFTATVAPSAPGSGVPMGSVTFSDGGTPIAVTTLGGGVATFTTSTLAIGNHSITTAYHGSPDYNVSSSVQALQAVRADDTTSKVTSSVNPSSIGQSVTLTATVTAIAPGGGIPGGTVTFNDDGVAMSGGSGILLDNSGQATFSFTFTASGLHNITVDFGDTDNNYNDSTSSILQQFVNDVAPTVTTAITAPTTPPYNEGSSITVTATTTDPNMAESFTYSWTVLKDGAAYTSGTTSSAAGANTSDFTFTPDDNGDYLVLLTATDSGGGSGIAAPLSYAMVNVAPVLGNLAISSPVNEGGLATLTGMMSDPGTRDNLTLTVDWGDGTAAQNFSYLAGTASFSVTHQYLDNGTFLPSLTLADKDGGSFNGLLNATQVNNVAPITAINGAPTTTVEGMTINLTSTVTDPSPVDTAAGFAYSWSVTKNGSAFGINGSSATYAFTPDAVGATPDVYVVALTATDKDGGVSAPATATINVTNVAPTVAIIGAPAISPVGASITLASQVSDPGSGDVLSYAWSVTGHPFTGTLTNGTTNTNGANYDFTPGASGNYVVHLTITDLAGDTATASVNIGISNANTSVTVATSGSPTVFGESVTFTATINPAASGGPTGIVTFVDGATPVFIAPVTTVAGNQVATFTTSALAVATHTITAQYSGDADFNPSSSSLGQVVNQASTSTVIASSSVANTSVIGEPVTFTAMVSPTTPGVSTISGTVTFKDGAATLGTGSLNAGAASITTSALALGGHSITALYNGDADFTSSTSATLTQTVNQDTTTAVLASSINPALGGQAVTLQIH